MVVTLTQSKRKLNLSKTKWVAHAQENACRSQRRKRKKKEERERDGAMIIFGWKSSVENSTAENSDFIYTYRERREREIQETKQHARRPADTKSPLTHTTTPTPIRQPCRCVTPFVCLSPSLWCSLPSTFLFYFILFFWSERWNFIKINE